MPQDMQKNWVPSLPLKASRSSKKRPSPVMVRFQATQSHPEWEGDEITLQAYTQAFYASYALKSQQG